MKQKNTESSVSSLVNIAAITGVAAAVGCTAYLAVLYLLGHNPFGRYKFLYLAIYALFFMAALWRYRVKNNHQLSSVRGLGIGIVLNLTATSLYGLLVFALITVTEQEALNRHLEELQTLQARNIAVLQEEVAAAKAAEDLNAEEKLSEQLETFVAAQTLLEEKGLTPAMLAVDQALGLFMAGFFLTFLYMLLFRSRSEKNAPSPAERYRKK